jgi:hypothetical protein
MDYFLLRLVGMVVLRLLSREGRNFPGWGGKNLLLAKKHQKRYNFSQKVKKYYFWLTKAGRGQEALPDAHACALVNLTTIDVF